MSSGVEIPTSRKARNVGCRRVAASFNTSVAWELACNRLILLRNIPITLINLQESETKAHTCENA